jgi:predicted MFS family arabinose efflux permease
MSARIWFGILIGSSVGGLVPELWGADMLSYSSILLSGAGGLVGLWIAYRTA